MNAVAKFWYIFGFYEEMTVCCHRRNLKVGYLHYALFKDSNAKKR